MSAVIIPGTGSSRRILRNAGFVVGALIVGVVLIVAILAPWIAPYDPFAIDLNRRLVPPMWMEGGTPANLLGTDQLGRDYLSRLIYGARISMIIGIATVITSGIIGTVIGVLGGFYGGRVDDVVMFLITARLSIPVVLVALAVAGLMGSSFILVILVLGLLLWDRFAVVARSTTMQIRTLDYVSAAWCSGCSQASVLLREVLPNIATHLAVVATLEMALAILLAGGVAQAIGTALFEEVVLDGAGTVLTRVLRDYHVPQLADLPLTEVYFADTRDDLGPYGAKSMSESTYNPVAPALANAVHDAVGTRLYELPMSRDRVWRALQS